MRDGVGAPGDPFSGPEGGDLRKSHAVSARAVTNMRNKVIFFEPRPQRTCPIATTHQPDIFSTKIKGDNHTQIKPTPEATGHHILETGLWRALPNGARSRNETTRQTASIRRTPLSADHPKYFGAWNSVRFKASSGFMCEY